MTLDSEEQRAFLLEIIDNTSFVGRARHKVIELSRAVETAEVRGPPIQMVPQQKADR